MPNATTTAWPATRRSLARLYRSVADLLQPAARNVERPASARQPTTPETAVLDALLESIFRCDTGVWIDLETERPIDEGLGGASRHIPPEGFYSIERTGPGPADAMPAVWDPHPSEALQDLVEQIRRETVRTLKAAGQWEAASMRGPGSGPWDEAERGLAD